MVANTLQEHRWLFQYVTVNSGGMNSHYHARSLKYNRFIDGRDIEPLRELFSMDEDDRVLYLMLNTDESFEKEEGKKLVTKDEIINRIYEAIFVNQYEGRTYSIELGEYQFTKESKTLAISSSSMMTHFTELA